jgi:NADP-dependent 3-hydroxy acid dehydrogenase YdfG
MKLEGKNAIVTGVSKGIGLETAKSLLEQGARVVGWSRTKPEIKHENFSFIPVDMGKFQSVKEAFEHSRQLVDDDFSILINNAGIGYQSEIEQMDHEKWHKMFDTNVHGVFYATQLVIPGMKKFDEGHIINIASIAGTNGLETMSGYCATKHAVVGISHSLFKELRNYGIKVTCVMPGSVNTQFFDTIDSIQANENMMTPQDIADSIVYILKTNKNYLVSDLEVRPLKPKG